jgi:hypothetical protein
MMRLEVARQAMAEILESTNDQMIISEGRLQVGKVEEEANAAFGDEMQKLLLVHPKRQYVFEETFLAGVRTSKKRDKPGRLRCVLLSDMLLVLAPLPDSDEVYVKLVLPLASLGLVRKANSEYIFLIFLVRWMWRTELLRMCTVTSCAT